MLQTFLYREISPKFHEALTEACQVTVLPPPSRELQKKAMGWEERDADGLVIPRVKSGR